MISIYLSRFSLSTVLYTSVLSAFIASILDLSQLLERGHHNVDLGIDLTTVTGLIVAREIGFSVSVGLRFFFYWLYVAEPPRGEIVTPMPLSPEATTFALGFKDGTHSGAWGRWGFIGVFLKWALLGITIVIGILQIIWRIVPADNLLGGVYAAEAALEIVVSALFILKLVLNIILTHVSPRSKVVKWYAAIAFALLINAGVGIGNVTYCESIWFLSM